MTCATTSKQKAFLKTIIVLIVFGSAVNAKAEGGAGAKFALLGGYSVPDADNTNPHQFYGVKGSATIVGSLGLGGYYTNTGTEEGSGGIKYDYSLHGVELNYAVSNQGGETYLGFRVGLTKIRTNQNGTSVLFSPYHYGFVIGYDHPIASWFTLGFEGSYLRVEKASDTISGTSYQIATSNIINFLLALNLRF